MTAKPFRKLRDRRRTGRNLPYAIRVARMHGMVRVELVDRDLSNTSAEQSFTASELLAFIEELTAAHGLLHNPFEIDLGARHADASALTGGAP